MSPKTWPFGLKWLPPATYLVGGNVRDALLGRSADYLDLDFVMPARAVETAKAIANHYRAGFVLLDAERQIARVVFERATADFAQQVGPSLETDLQRRDFTVNAIAYNPHTQEIIDPLGGYLDLERRHLRMIALENLKEDPLRLLRAYRQAAQLGFALEPETRAAVQHLSGLLSEIAPERIQSELNYLLSSALGTPFLTLAGQDGLLQDWLPQAMPDQLAQVEAVDAVAIALIQRWPKFEPLLLGWLRDQPRNTGLTPTWLKLAKLASLVSSDPQQAELELWHLKYSRAEVQAVSTILRLLPEVPQIADPGASRKSQYLFFKQAGVTFPALAVLTAAMQTPTPDAGKTWETERSLNKLDFLMERFLTPGDPVAHPTPLLSGTDLMKMLHLRPGPHIGRLIEAIQIAQAEGKISDALEALDFAQQSVEGECYRKG